MKLFLLEWEPSNWEEINKPNLSRGLEIIKIKPPSRNSGLVSYYLGTTRHNQDGDTKQKKDGDTRKKKEEEINEAIAFATHFKAIREFLSTGDKEALICDQNIILNDDFVPKLRKMRANLSDQESYSLLSFAYLIESWDGSQWAGKDPSQENLCRILPSVDGSNGYLITREWAINALVLFDRPWNQLALKDRSVDAIIQNSGGYLAVPHLAEIDD
jgi:hypothetical protein